MMPPQGEDPNQPYPGVGAALLLTIMAVFASVFTGIAFFGLGALTAYGVGRAVGVGAVAPWLRKGSASRKRSAWVFANSRPMRSP